MTNQLVIVAAERIDSTTENNMPHQSKKGAWVFELPCEFGDLAEKVFSKLNPIIKEHINTVITCSAADDSYARHRCAVSDRIRPRDVMAALGVSLAQILSNNLPNLRNTFKVDAACASGLTALELAKLIASTSGEVVLIAAVDKSTSPHFLNLFQNIGALTQDNEVYRGPFDVNRSGFAMGEGAALLAITTLEQAKKRDLNIIATVNAINTETILTHPTSPSDPKLLEQFIRRTITNSKKDLTDFAAWDAHATATPNGDKIEYNVFNNIFKNQHIAISSYKGKVGHCMAASAVIEIVNAIEHLQQGLISPTSNLSESMVNDPRIIDKPTPTDKKTFIKTSFGFGGRNGAAVITVQ